MDKIYYKIVDNKTIFATRKSIINHNGVSIFNPTEEQLLDAGYQEYIEPSKPELSEEELLKQRLTDEMNNLKELLASEDYKIIKCAEAFMEGKDLPYDLENLIKVRDSRRTRINDIEERLK